MSQKTVLSKSKWQRRVDLLTGIVAAWPLATLFARQWWVADVLANLRVQLILGLIAAMVGLIIMRQWKRLAAIAVLTLWQLTTLGSAFVPPESQRVVRQAQELGLGGRGWTERSEGSPGCFWQTC